MAAIGINEELVDDIDEEELDRLLESGDPEAIDKYLAGEKSDVDSGSSTAELDDVTKDDEREADSDEENADGEAEGEADAKAKADDVPDDAVIKTKDGKHEIPISELQNARKENQQLKQQLQSKTTSKKQETRELKEKLDELVRRNELYTKQLESNKLDPAKLPEEIEFDDDQLEYFDSLDPKLGAGMRNLVAVVSSQREQIAQLKSAPKQQEQASKQETATDDPVVIALEKNAALSSWRDSDPERWAEAVRIDAILQKDPAFKTKSLDESFNEVVRRVCAIFGDPAPSTPDAKTPGNKKPDADARAKADEKLAKAAAQIPQSLTDVGRSSSAERSLAERLSDMSAEQISEYMTKHNLSSEQIDELLAASIG